MNFDLFRMFYALLVLIPLYSDTPPKDRILQYKQLTNDFI